MYWYLYHVYMEHQRLPQLPLKMFQHCKQYLIQFTHMLFILYLGPGKYIFVKCVAYLYTVAPHYVTTSEPPQN